MQVGGNIFQDPDILILFWIRKNYHSRGKNLLLYLFIKRVIK
jgi:hypothetical protein